MTFDGGSQGERQLRQAFQRGAQNQKWPARKTKQPVGIRASLADCCYSVSNLALIVGCILALVFAAKFLNDESLYDYGEHLLTWRFYRQVVYIVVVLPLVLLVPLFNAVTSIFLNDRLRSEFGRTLLSAKLIYQALLAALVLIGLVFIAPSIRFTSVASQVGHELRRHMKRRYDNDFSYEFLDRIQEEYQCCDQAWYSANLPAGKLPLSCYQPDGLYTIIYEQDCAHAIGALVSDRCSAVAAGLFAILVALAILLAADASELLSFGSRKYNVGARESLVRDSPAAATTATAASASQLESLADEPTRRANWTPSSAGQPLRPAQSGEENAEEEQRLEQQEEEEEEESEYLVDEIKNRLRLDERERETPLLPPKQAAKHRSLSQPGSREPVLLAPLSGRPSDDDDDGADDDDDDGGGGGGGGGADSSPGRAGHFGAGKTPVGDPFNARLPAAARAPILTRANYDLEMPDDRPQSPMFVSQVRLADSSTSLGGQTQQQQPLWRRQQQQQQQQQQVNERGSQRSLTPTKSALKKTSSFQRIDDNNTEAAKHDRDDDEDDNYDRERGDLIRYQREIHRELQTRRSLLNVRFAE